MKKTVFLSLIPIVVLSSCKITFDNGIEPFGDASIPFDIAGMFDDTTFFKVGDKMYVDAGAMASGVEKGECIAALNGRDHYSYRFYAVEGHEELLIVNFYSRINIVDAYRIYASEQAEYIPVSLLMDFPHHDNWFDGGKEITIGGLSYCSYYSYEKGLSAGELLYSEHGRSYYALVDHPLWLVAPNRKSESVYDLFYRNDIIDRLDADIVWAVSMIGRD